MAPGAGGATSAQSGSAQSGQGAKLVLDFEHWLASLFSHGAYRSEQSSTPLPLLQPCAVAVVCGRVKELLLCESMWCK